MAPKRVPGSFEYPDLCSLDVDLHQVRSLSGLAHEVVDRHGPHIDLCPWPSGRMDDLDVGEVGVRVVRLDREGRSGPRYASPSRALLQPSLVRPPLQNVTCEATAAAAATVLLLTQTACRVQEMPWRPPRERLVSAAVPSQRAWAEAEVGHVHPVLAPLGRVAPASSSHGAAPSPPAQRAESPAEDVERVWG